MGGSDFPCAVQGLGLSEFIAVAPLAASDRMLGTQMQLKAALVWFDQRLVMGAPKLNVAALNTVWSCSVVNLGRSLFASDMSLG